jgi:uncharacterized protein YjiS (DUF1127 family)
MKQGHERMSAIADHSPSLPAGGTIRGRSFGRIFRNILAVTHAWQRHIRQRRELLMLTDIELCEFSLSEADVNREARKPFWETIELSRR